MAKPCKQLYADLNALQQNQFKQSLDVLSSKMGLEVDGRDPESALLALHEKTQLPLDTLRNAVYNGFSDEGKQRALEDYKKTSSSALTFAQSLGTKEGIANGWSAMKAAAVKGVTAWMGTVKHLPIQGKDFMNALIRLGGEKNFVALGDSEAGTPVFSGAEAGHNYRSEQNALYDKVNKVNPTNKELFREAIGLAHATRDELGKGFDGGYLKSMLAVINHSRATMGADYAKHEEQIIRKAQELIQNPDVQKFVANTHQTLRTIAKILKANGEITSERASYFPNLVRMMMNDNSSGLDSALFGKKFSSGDMAQIKTYRSAVEASLNGYKPKSFAADDMMGVYHTKIGDRMAQVGFKNSIVKNMDEWTVQPAADVKEVAFHTFDKGEKPEMRTADGQYYKNLGNLNHRFDGIYAHPIMAKQMEKIWKIPQQTGLLASVKRGNEAFKGLLFSMNLFHAKTLATKGVELLAGAQAVESATAKDPFQVFINPFTMVRRGLDAIKGYHPEILKMAAAGVTFRDGQWEKPLMESHTYDPITGEKQVNLWHQITTLGGVSTWINNGIFHSLQAGMKAGIGLQLTQTEMFRKWVSEKGEDYAYQNLASLLNNHLGGQNLVSQGRSQFVQAFLRAGMLAPDFQESKWRRNFGIFHADKNLRAVYQASLGVEAVLVGTTLLAVQGLFDEIRGEKRSMASWIHDSVGHWLDIQMGKDSNGRNTYVTLLGSEKEDFRPMASLFVNYLEAASGTNISGAKPQFDKSSFWQKVYKPAVIDLANEARNKSSPMASAIINIFDKTKPKAGINTMFDLPYMPMSLQAPAYAALGGFGNLPGEQAKYLGASLLASAVGAPISEGRAQKEKAPSISELTKRIKSGPKKATSGSGNKKLRLFKTG